MAGYRRLLEAAPALCKADFERLRSGWHPRVTKMHFAVQMALAAMARR